MCKNRQTEKLRKVGYTGEILKFRGKKEIKAKATKSSHLAILCPVVMVIAEVVFIGLVY